MTQIAGEVLQTADSKPQALWTFSYYGRVTCHCRASVCTPMDNIMAAAVHPVCSSRVRDRLWTTGILPHFLLRVLTL